MGKNGELWDDSALIRAFDDAISKFKIMHGIGGNECSLNEERITKGTEDSSPFFDEGIEDKSVYLETNDNTMKNENTTDSSSTEKHHSEIIEQNVSPSNGDNHVQDTNNTSTIAKTTDDYNVLLNQYNSVEEKRQKLLEKLYQYGNWNYQGYDYKSYDSQYYPAPTPQASDPSVCSCRAYACPYSTGETCVGNPGLAQNGSSVSVEDGAFIKAAMGAVDRAVCSFNREDKEGKKTEKVETGLGNMGRDKTDLSVVLNAWFSAGFYTGKYLSEQSSSKK